MKNDIEFYLIDDGGPNYHFFVKYNGKFYDAYNYKGVTNLSDLQFCKIYMSKYNDNYLLKHLKFVSNGEFDEAKANRYSRTSMGIFLSKVLSNSLSFNILQSCLPL